MSVLTDFVDVQISKQTASITRAGFGVPMIMSAEATGLLANTTKEYAADLAALTADGFATTGTTSKKFAKLISQNPKVSRIIVGKRTLPTKRLTVTPIVKDSTLYRITINGTNFDFTSDATATVAEITLGLTTAIDGGAENVNAVDNTTSLTIESSATPGGVPAAGVPFHMLVNDRTLLEVQNITADPGLVADLSTIRTAVDGNDSWYLAILDNSGKDEIEALAGAIETIPKKAFFAETSDADVITASTTDVGSVLQSNTYARTAFVWHHNPDDGPEAGYAGRGLPSDPGSITWNLLSSVVGVPASPLSTSEQGFLDGKNANYFLVLGGQTVPQEGKMAGGEFIDVTRGVDFIQDDIEVRIFGDLVRLPKIPFTDPGIAIIEADVRAAMDQGIAQGILAADPAPVVTVPLAADVDINDRANRLLPDVTFTATLAGAVHKVEVRGVVTV